jgi:crotonobetainyl-CoA:carnitine CoA-transferase CaiB-like acyl-CoA transferase
MTKPLAGIKVIEVTMWAYVPTAGGVLADWGADVVKIEPPSGDPMRGLTSWGIKPGAYGFTLTWDVYNRGKRGIVIDLSAPGAADLLYKMVAGADVFLTSLLPAARRKLRIDVEDIRRANPKIIYATGSGQGALGDEAEKGGFDAISFWARSGCSSGATPDDAPYPLGMPAAAFGDVLGGLTLAGGIAAAIAQRERTGKGSVVDGSLLATGMWAMQMNITTAKLIGVPEMPKLARNSFPNPLVNCYRTSDGSCVFLCMLQSQRYWAELCRAMGRADLIDDPRFATDAGRATNKTACIAELDRIFAAKTLTEWRAILATQEGQWDVVQRAGDLPVDRQALANGYVQDVEYGDGRVLTMVSTPVQFDRVPFPIRPAPEHGQHTEEVLMELGMNMDQILEAKVAGIVG